ncbi:sigma-70 family RNA polymerase sigma factor [Nocardia sp. NPDC057030]|uniref:sigma-70 family RNA polymerase sigma factor n=1 Tax=unclassified Nocardia TaxID=2637762 RepID=UPI0036459B22
MDATAEFLAHRNLLFTIAHAMLGSTADAENILRETWLHWQHTDCGQVGDPRTYLVRILTRRSVHRLRSSEHRGESATRRWLPTVLPTPPDAAARVELAERMSMALLAALETLAPTERAVYLLRESFDLGYDEIADAVGMTPAEVRRIAYRARRHVTVRRPQRAVAADRARAAADSVRRALNTADVRVLLDVLAPDVVFVSDGGADGSAMRPITGADKVAQFLVGGRPASFACEPVTVDGLAALAVQVGPELEGTLAISVDGDRIAGFYFVRDRAPQSGEGRDRCRTRRARTMDPPNRDGAR